MTSKPSTAFWTFTHDEGHLITFDRIDAERLWHYLSDLDGDPTQRKLFTAFADAAGRLPSLAKPLSDLASRVGELTPDQYEIVTDRCLFARTAADLVLVETPTPPPLRIGRPRNLRHYPDAVEACWEGETFRLVRLRGGRLAVEIIANGDRHCLCSIDGEPLPDDQKAEPVSEHDVSEAEVIAFRRVWAALPVTA